ncbi:MAG: hypothetical protein CM15mP67_09290 [Alphaproteobacteria bacterium]|nr:MAG: hypothetical protein CM15mP67_09290 [Alphaproteobacteria bacterium]
MLEKCLKCNTSFEVDESLITSKLKFFKCSVCDNEWPFVNNKNSEKSSENISEEKLRKDLDAIRSEIEKKTDILSKEIKVQPKEKIIKVKNQNYNTKKKTVAQIAEEIAEASVKNRETKIIKNKKQINKKTSNIETLKNVNSKQKSFAIPLIIFISILVISSSVYFRNNVVSLSHFYFPNFVEKNFHKVFDLFKHVKIPFYADFKNLEIENFGAVYEGKSVKFFGNIKNNSKYSILTPTLKVIMTTEDGKILAETIIKSTQPFIESNNFIKINHLILTNQKYNNATIRATIMKEIESVS